jgi:hypothetical protein
MDEAGNTGENLLDAAQPIYALAGVRVDDEAHRAITAALARTQLTELKFQRLRTSGVGRRNILKLLDEVELRPGTAAVMVAHKPWMFAAKLVDELIEPRMLAKGIQMAWYATGAAKRMADALFELAPSALGDLYAELQAAFVVLLRDYSEENAATFLEALRHARLVCADEQMHELFSVMIDTPAEIRDEFATRHDALDPGLTLLHCQAGRWSALLGTPFEVVHDESNTVRRWARDLEEIAGGSRSGAPPRPQSLVVGEIEIHLPRCSSSSASSRPSTTSVSNLPMSSQALPPTSTGSIRVRRSRITSPANWTMPASRTSSPTRWVQRLTESSPISYARWRRRG